jgi:Fur family peroxide stress response transcriptional regulator
LRKFTDHKRSDIIIQKLRDNGHKITPQRLAIVHILAKSESHPSVEDIHVQIKNDFPTMSLATVYRNIVLLKSLGEVLELGFPDGSNRYDGNKPNTPSTTSSASNARKSSIRTWTASMK